MGRILPGKSPQKQGKIPPQRPPLEDENLVFSFRHLDVRSNPKFCLSRCKDGYLSKFLERLKTLNSITVRDFRENKSKSVRSHTHDWSRTSEKGGFHCLNEQLRDLPGWQFEISSNEHGRVHGFIIERTFFVVGSTLTISFTADVAGNSFRSLACI
jgi:hypothetical protein